MSKSRHDLDYLGDIQEALERILDYTNLLDWKEYIQDYKTQDAVVRNLEILGEAVKGISLKFRATHPEVPWRELAGTRDRLIHQYFGINQEIVWQIIVNDLPDLKKQIDGLIENNVESGNLSTES